MESCVPELAPNLTRLFLNFYSSRIFFDDCKPVSVQPLLTRVMAPFQYSLCQDCFEKSSQPLNPEVLVKVQYNQRQRK